MSLQSILNKIPAAMPDLKENFQKLFIHENHDSLTKDQRCAIALAVSYHLRDEALINGFRNEAKLCLEDHNVVDIKAVVVMITRNNLFYRFTTESENDEISKSKIELHEQAISGANTDKILLMMCILAVSMMNNCNMCKKFYTDKLLRRDVQAAAVVSIARIMSVLSAVSEAIEIDSLRTYDYGSW